jgi:hypothetical protein
MATMIRFSRRLSSRLVRSLSLRPSARIPSDSDASLFFLRTSSKARLSEPETEMLWLGERGRTAVPFTQKRALFGRSVGG